MRRLEDHLRADRLLIVGHLIVRGSPNTAAKLLDSARRLGSQYTYRDTPAYGFSVNSERSRSSTPRHPRSPTPITSEGDREEPFLARVVDIVDGAGGTHIVHLDVLGVPEQLVDELRRSHLLEA